jgi:hypothetical protein
MAKLLILIGVLLLTLSATGSTRVEGPGLTISNLKDGARIAGTTVTVDFAVSNFEVVTSNVPLSEAGKHPELNRPGQGHLHLMLDMQPLVVWTNTQPYTYHNVPPGDHQLMVELANNDHSSLSPRVVRQIHFQNELPLPVSGAVREIGLQAIGELLGFAVLVLVAGMILLRRKTA